jgi:hypothetical protein
VAVVVVAVVAVAVVVELVVVVMVAMVVLVVVSSGGGGGGGTARQVDVASGDGGLLWGIHWIDDHKPPTFRPFRLSISAQMPRLASLLAVLTACIAWVVLKRYNLTATTGENGHVPLLPPFLSFFHHFPTDTPCKVSILYQPNRMVGLKF